MQIDNLLSLISADPATRPDAVFARLTRLLAAPGAGQQLHPAGHGRAGDSAAGGELGLRCAPVGSSGNLAIEIGDAAAPLDLLISAHMDRPCFRVRDAADGTLYPLCAIRVPGDGYTCGAVGLRYVDGRVRSQHERRHAL